MAGVSREILKVGGASISVEKDGEWSLVGCTNSAIVVDREPEHVDIGSGGGAIFGPDHIYLTASARFKPTFERLARGDGHFSVKFAMTDTVRKWGVPIELQTRVFVPHAMVTLGARDGLRIEAIQDEFSYQAVVIEKDIVTLWRWLKAAWAMFVKWVVG